MEIVGIVGPVKQRKLNACGGRYLFTTAADRRTDDPWLRYSTFWVIKTSRGTPGIEQAVRAQIRSLDSSVAFDIRPMSGMITAALATRQFTLLLVGFFAGAALFLAAAGLYAVMSYGVQQRTREIGVRLALGATHSRILGMILREGGVLIGSGLAVGLLAALITTKLVASQVYEVSPRDPLSFAIVSLVLCTIAFIAAFIAARRVLLVDPIIALRSE